jgi:predicted ATP-grasp superfamily ATP-dependent carboligase
VRNTVGALVVGGEHPGLGVARSLGRRGIPVFVLDDGHSVSKFSRYVSKFIRVKSLRDPRTAVDAALDAGRRFGLDGWVLYPTRDEHVAAFSQWRDELSTVFRVSTPRWDTVKWAWDKKNSYELGERLGLPVPGTWTVRSVDELSTLYDRLPLAIKPAIKEHFFYATRAKAWRADTPEQLREHFERAAHQISHREILIQEIIPGGGDRQFSYCAFYRDGRAHSTLVARRCRQHPREFGRAATYVETLDLPAIETLADRFLKSIDFYGLVEIEFKQDPRDGQFKLIDVNARTWGFHSLGAAAGVDFPYLLFADQVGLPTTPARARAGVGWLRLVTDVPTAFSDMVHGHLGVAEYFQSLARTRTESVFNWRDPMPTVGELLLLPYMAAREVFGRSSAHEAAAAPVVEEAAANQQATHLRQ